MNEKDAVKQVMEGHFSARLDGDLDSALDSYSKDWCDSKGYRKSSLRKDHLTFDFGAHKSEIDVDLSSVEISVEDDRATFGPVVIFTTKGSVTYAYSLKKEIDGHSQKSLPLICRRIHAV